MHRLTSAAEQVIRSFWDIMPDPELSERFWTGKLPLRSFKKTICLEAVPKSSPRDELNPVLMSQDFAMVCHAFGNTILFSEKDNVFGGDIMKSTLDEVCTI
jgi:hypothetical protein